MIRKQRVIGTIRNSVLTAYKDNNQAQDETIWEGIAGGVVDSILLIHQDKVAAGLRRLGLEVEDGAVISQASLTALVAQKTGIEITSLDSDEIASKVAAALSKDLSNRVGFDVDLSNGLNGAIDAAVEAAMASGRANKLVSGNTARKMRTMAAAFAAGVSEQDYKRINNAKRQATWRQGKAFSWVER